MVVLRSFNAKVRNSALYERHLPKSRIFGDDEPFKSKQASKVEERQSPISHGTSFNMSGKYAFTKALKELRFHHCQTSDHSAAVRYVWTDRRSCFGQREWDQLEQKINRRREEG